MTRLEAELDQTKINSNTVSTATGSKYQATARTTSNTWEACKAFLGSTICKIYRTWSDRCRSNRVVPRLETVEARE